MIEGTAHVRVGPYEVRSLLGRGGGGTVYRAWDPRLQREVALKILHKQSAPDPDRLRRFVEESRAASALNHPNIVVVFDTGVDADTPYIVSELIDGQPLREEITRGPLTLRRLLDIAAQIADGLSAAHEAGIVHRDLKPENVMVTRAGRVKIVDFGLSGNIAANAGAVVGSLEIGQTVTTPGLHAGTVPYMSPEQARGGLADRHSDQFALGLILFEMITGRAAFRRADAASTLHAIINDDVPAASLLDPRIPVQLRWIVERCLAKDGQERYASTSDLHRELRTLRDRLSEVLASLEQSALPAGIGRWRGIAIATGIALVAAGAVLFAVSRMRPPIDPSTFAFSPLATEAGYEGYPAWSPSGDVVAYTADVDGVLQIFTRQLSASASAQVTHSRFDCSHPFWSSDGKRIFFVSLAQDTDGIWSIGAAGGTPQVVVKDAIRGAMSPDGRTLAFLRDEQSADVVGAAALWVATPQGSEPWTATTVEESAMRHPGFRDFRFVEAFLAFSPDGRRLGIAAVRRSIDLDPQSRGWQFWVAPATGGNPTRRFQWWTDAAPRTASFAWLPDGRHVVLGVTSLSTTGSDLWLGDLDRDQTWPLTRGPDSEFHPSVSPTGQQVVFTRDESDYDLITIPLDTRPGSGGTETAAPRVLMATARNESEPAWSADGRLLAYVTDRSGQEEIWVRSREGQRWIDRPLIRAGDFGDDRTIMLGAPTFSPDGRRIAYLRNAQRPMIWPLRIWTSLTTDGGTSGTPVPLLPATREGYQSAPTWSPDGQWIAFTEWRTNERMLAKVRVGSGGNPDVLRGDGVADATPHWSPNNDWITWETDRGLLLVSPDGQHERLLPTDLSNRWRFHEWSADGRRLVGIKDAEASRLVVTELEVSTGRERVLAELGPVPPVNNPVKGFTLSRDGRTVTVATVHLRGDLWRLDGLRLRRGLLGRFDTKNP